MIKDMIYNRCFIIERLVCDKYCGIANHGQIDDRRQTVKSNRIVVRVLIYSRIM